MISGTIKGAKRIDNEFVIADIAVKIDSACRNATITGFAPPSLTKA